MPYLPFELERIIFELAAQATDHHQRVQMSLVAKRVHEWIRQIIYSVAIAKTLRDSPLVFIQNWRIAQVADVAQFVRHLLIIVNNEDQILEQLTTFRNVENLAVWNGSPITPKSLTVMNGLPLRMFSADLSGIGPDEITTSVFQNLTHLEILDLNGSGVQELSDDPRFVVFKEDLSLKEAAEEWERSINGHLGLWELAEKIIEARKKNLFKHNSWCTFSRHDWTIGLNDNGMRWLKAWTNGCQFQFRTV